MKEDLKPVESPSSLTDDSPPHQRPKRNSSQKNLLTSNGLLWREETDLKRALYASLQESRKRALEDGDPDPSKDNDCQSPGQEGNSRDTSPKRTKVHAQRKFAQCSASNSPLPTPMKVNNSNSSSSEFLSRRRPKTEDFLTFLCLRGSTILPPSLSFLNICSKSGTGSDSRCVSPDLEVGDFPYSKKESNTKQVDLKLRNGVKQDLMKNDFGGRPFPCKASASQSRSNYSYSKVVKEVNRKRKSLEEKYSENVPSKMSSSRIGINYNDALGGGTVPSSMKNLREKYKQKRLATDNKNKTSIHMTSTKNQNQANRTISTKQSQVTTRNKAKSLRDVPTRVHQKPSDQRLALEKRRALRSASPRRHYPSNRRPIRGHTKSTPWLRKAKLVPPVVDVDSESEPEVITISPTNTKSQTKKFATRRNSEQNQAPSSIKRNDRHLPDKKIDKRKSLCSIRTRTLRLREKQNSSKHLSTRSRGIGKPTRRIDRARKMKKSIATAKTMLLRNDSQISKRVTRSATKPPQELQLKRSNRIQQMASKESNKCMECCEKRTLPPRRKSLSALKERESSSRILKHQVEDLDNSEEESEAEIVKKQTKSLSDSETTSSKSNYQNKSSSVSKENKVNRISDKTNNEVCSSKIAKSQTSTKEFKKEKLLSVTDTVSTKNSSSQSNKRRASSNDDARNSSKDSASSDSEFVTTISSSANARSICPKDVKVELVKSKQPARRNSLQEHSTNSLQFSKMKMNVQSVSVNLNDCQTPAILQKIKMLQQSIKLEKENSSVSHTVSTVQKTDTVIQCDNSQKATIQSSSSSNKSTAVSNCPQVSQLQKPCSEAVTSQSAEDLIKVKESLSCEKNSVDTASVAELPMDCDKSNSVSVMDSTKVKDTSKKSNTDSGHEKSEQTKSKKSGSSSKEEKKSHKSSRSGNKDSNKIKKKNAQKKKDGDHHKVKKDGESSKSKSHSKSSVKSSKRDDKDGSRSHKKDSDKLLTKALKREMDRDHLKSKKDSDRKSKYSSEDSVSSSSKLLKTDSDRESSKSSRKDSDRDSSFSERTSSSKSLSSESKKDKSSKKLSPKKKKKKDHKNFDKLSLLFKDDSKFSSLKKKRRSSSEKSALKKLLAKTKKRKKPDLLKSNKLSKKLSSKLLRKYAKKKRLKIKKNKMKLKKKKDGSSTKSSSQSEKSHKDKKEKKQKHKSKSDHHKKDGQEKKTSHKSEHSTSSTSTSTDVAVKSDTNVVPFVQVTNVSTSTSVVHETAVQNPTYIQQHHNIATSSYVTENIAHGVSVHAVGSMTDNVTTHQSLQQSSYMAFNTADEFQTIVNSDFHGVFEETAYVPGTILFTTRESIAQVPVHFIQDVSVPKVMADAATNTSDDDLVLENLNICQEPLRSEEMSVGTQTMTPVGSPTPILELPMISPPLPTQQVLKQATSSQAVRMSPALPSSTNVPTHDMGCNAMPIQANASCSAVPSSSTKTSIPTKRRKSISVPSAKKSKAFDPNCFYKDPLPDGHPGMCDAPVYRPSAKEFLDPVAYIEKIQPEAAQYGICKIIPPSTFKPECKVNDDMRFTAHNQYVHKMLYRWGPNVQHVACIKKHLKSQKVHLDQAPLIGGIELDLSKFYQTVQQFGGLQKVIEKKKWHRVADSMHIPKAAQDRVTKLYDAYCKYLVSYETLPFEEKKKIRDEVIQEHEKRIKVRTIKDKDDYDDEDEENNDCVSKGRSTTLSNFFRVARNTMSMWYKNKTTPEEVEHEFWKLVTDRQQHVVVHAGNIDSSVYNSGFPSNRSSAFAKHPWNLKVMTNNPSSILRCMGPVSGVTIPTLHVGMLFTTCCWYRDPHSLHWIEYMHTGASKVWYSIPAKGREKFRAAMNKIMPEQCGSNPIWLASDTAMVPPSLLVKHGVTLSRTVQHSGQFIVIFPEAFTSTICSGYSVSESVYFAPPSWLDLAQKAFPDIRDSCEPPTFSLERLLFCIANDPKTVPETLQKILPMIRNIRDEELRLRKKLDEMGLKQCERLPLLEVKEKVKKKKSRGIEEDSEQECEICRTHCYISMVIFLQEDIYCLHHAIEHIPEKDLKHCKLVYTYDENELEDLIKKTKEQISVLQTNTNRKKSPKKKLTVLEK